MTRTVRIAGLIAGCFLCLSGCTYIAVHSADQKVAATSRSPNAIAADKQFWEVFHAGRYDQISPMLETMTQAYLETPNDPVTAAHVGWLHIWRLSERNRLPQVPATITDEAVMSHKYFQEAVTLDPSDARYLGFLGSTELAEGAIHHDDRMTRTGYFTIKDSATRYPEFNLFTAGYSMSTTPVASSQFKEALEMQWQNLDVCVGEKVDRANPDFSRYMKLATTEGPKRVCWNGWIAPHNLEGFMLNMGDMLVKSGDLATAKKIYANARNSATYQSWPYKAVLEQRIVDTETNQPLFVQNKGIMINTAFSCGACHTAS